MDFQKPKRFKKFFREPLVHFLAIGAMIYAINGIFNTNNTNLMDQNTITITTPEIDWLKTSWQMRYKRKPNQKELKGLMDDYIRQSIYYREAISMGLNEDDIIIRRRLTQKLEFLTMDLAESVKKPTQEDLKIYLKKNVDRYKIPPEVTFSQVYFSSDKRGNKTTEDAKRVLSRLQKNNVSDEQIKQMGDSILLQSYYPAKPITQIGKLFGRNFSKELIKLPLEKWLGPINSSYGAHLVILHERTPEKIPDLSEIKMRVENDWVTDMRQESNDLYYSNLKARYNVILEAGL